MTSRNSFLAVQFHIDELVYLPASGFFPAYERGKLFASLMTLVLAEGGTPMPAGPDYLVFGFGQPLAAVSAAARVFRTLQTERRAAQPGPRFRLVLNTGEQAPDPDLPWNDVAASTAFLQTITPEDSTRYGLHWALHEKGGLLRAVKAPHGLEPHLSGLALLGPDRYWGGDSDFLALHVLIAGEEKVVWQHTFTGNTCIDAQVALEAEDDEIYRQAVQWACMGLTKPAAEAFYRLNFKLVNQRHPQAAAVYSWLAFIWAEAGDASRANGFAKLATTFRPTWMPVPPLAYLALTLTDPVEYPAGLETEPDTDHLLACALLSSANWPNDEVSQLTLFTAGLYYANHQRCDQARALLEDFCRRAAGQPALEKRFATAQTALNSPHAQG